MLLELARQTPAGARQRFGELPRARPRDAAMRIALRGAAPCLALLALSACGGPSDTHAAIKPAKVDPVAHESELMRITLTPEAERRLGIAVATASLAPAQDRVATHGEVVVPPAARGGVPITTATDLMTLAASQARADGDIARAAAQARVAHVNAQRADALVREEAGSVRARDDALATAAVAQADLAAARAQRHLLGAPVASLGRQDILWVRVPVLAADVTRIDRGAPAAIRPLGGGAGTLSGRPVAAPPSSNVAAGSIDLYYAIPNTHALGMGRRAAAARPAGGDGAQGLTIPAPAILHDAYGGEGVYVRPAPRTFERRRAQLAGISGGPAMPAMGLKPGDQAVTAGAAELFGTEFGAK